MSKEFIIRQIDDDKDLDDYSKQGWVVKQVITHEVVHNGVNGLKWDRYHILFERDHEDEDTKKLKAFEIVKNLCNLKVYKNKLGQCFLEGISILFPISQEKYDLLKEVLK